MLWNGDKLKRNLQGGLDQGCSTPDRRCTKIIDALMPSNVLSLHEIQQSESAREFLNF